MTMRMWRFRKIICFAAIFCTVISLVSCKRSKSNIDDVFEQLKISDDASDLETETEAPAFAEHVYVIISSQCSGELSVKAKELAEKIEDKTGVLTSLKYDNELTTVPKNSCEVVVGDTNRLVSKNAMDILKKDEYLCRIDDETVVICGHSDASTLVAVDRFINEILPLSSKYELMPKDMRFQFSAEYEVERMLLNGYDLYDYVLTYPKSNECGEKKIAIMLRDFINSKSGYFLEVLPSDDAAIKTSRIISLNGKAEENAVFSKEKEIALSGKDIYSLSLVAKRVINDINNGIKDNALDLKYDSKIEVEFVDTSFKSAFCFAKENKSEPFRPISNLIDLLSAGDLNFCFIGNPNDDMRYDFSLNLKKNVKIQEILLGERQIMVAYDETKLKTIDISIDENSNYIMAKVETNFGETICYVYVIQGKMSEPTHNTVMFYENCEDIEIENSCYSVRGEAKLSNGNMKYLLASRENLEIQNADELIHDDENGFYCVVKTKVLCSNDFLNNSLE